MYDKRCSSFGLPIPSYGYNAAASERAEMVGLFSHRPDSWKLAISGMYLGGNCLSVVQKRHNN